MILRRSKRIGSAFLQSVCVVLTLIGTAHAGAVEDFLLGLVQTFGPGGVALCKAAANPFSHSAADCDAAYALSAQMAEEVGTTVDEGIETAGECLGSPEECARQAAETAQQGFQTAAECLADLETCLRVLGEDALVQLGAAADSAFVTLRGRVRDDGGDALMGVLVTAAPKDAPLLPTTASTHRTFSGPDGLWRIDINRYLAYPGVYRVWAAGPMHDFTPVEYEVTVGP